MSEGVKIHTTADVQSEKIGIGTSIWQFSIVLSGAVIGANCNINCHVFIENDVIIGNNVTVKPGIQIWDGLRIEDDVFIGPNVTFTNDLLPRSKHYPEEYIKTVIKRGASIGANATILAGIEIGEYAMIGAGSVLTCSIESHSLWYGNPAKLRGYVTKNGKVITLELKDKDGNDYTWIEGEIVLNKK